MSTPAPNPIPKPDDEETRVYYERLVQTGQLVDVKDGEDPSTLPARVTHVRYPDGTIQRIRYAGLGRR